MNHNCFLCRLLLFISLIAATTASSVRSQPTTTEETTTHIDKFQIWGSSQNNQENSAHGVNNKKGSTLVASETSPTPENRPTSENRSPGSVAEMSLNRVQKSTNEIVTQFRLIFDTNYGGRGQVYEETVKCLKEKKAFASLANSTYESEAELDEKITNEIENCQTSKDVAFARIEQLLNVKYKKIVAFNHAFVDFLKSVQIQNQIDLGKELLSDDFIERHLRQLLPHFEAENAEIFRESLATQIALILQQKHPNVPGADVLKFIQSSKDFKATDLIYNETKLGEIVANAVARLTALQTLRSKLNNWFETLKNVNKNFVTFLHNYKDIKTSTIGSIRSKSEFLTFARTYFDEFSRIKQDLLRMEMPNLINAMLVKHYPKESSRHRTILIKLKAEGHMDAFVSVEFLYVPESLEKSVKPAINEIIRKLNVDDAYAKLEDNLRLWIRTFERDFLQFLEAKNIDVAEITNLNSDRKSFFSKSNVLHQEFIRVKKPNYSALVSRQVEEIARDFHQKDAGEKLRSTSVKVEQLGDLEKLSEYLAIKLDEINYAECRQLVEDKAEGSEKGNKCIATEICNQKSIFDQNYLNNQLKVYNYHRRKANSKIQDEIDETVFDIFRESLLQRNPDKAECIVNFLKRENIVDEVYTPELFFNDQMLSSRVSEALKDYENKYARTFSVTSVGRRENSALPRNSSTSRSSSARTAEAYPQPGQFPPTTTQRATTTNQRNANRYPAYQQPSYTYTQQNLNKPSNSYQTRNLSYQSSI